MRKLLIVLLTLTLLVSITGVAYAASEAGTPTTLGNDQMGNYSSYNFSPGYGDGDDNGLGNANSSGDYNIEYNTGTDAERDAVIKSDAMRNTPQDTTDAVQRTHGEYKNNTNSCASCHQTHTGAAASLLIKGGVYETCTACHDGTLGFYDVYSASSAGTFGGNMAGNASVHMADGTTTHKFAPGGNFTGEGTVNGSWTEVFDCASCHAPHGSYSDRLLHYSPNGMANVSLANGGQKLLGVQVYNFGSLPAVPAKPTEKDLIVVRGNASDLGVTTEAANETVLVVMKAVGTAWVKDDLPWLYGSDRATGLSNTTFYDPTIPSSLIKDQQLNKLVVNYGLGYAKGVVAEAVYGNIAGAQTADVARAYVVKLQSADFPLTDADGTGAAAGYFARKVNPLVYEEAANGIGVAIGKYCGACHTDYRAKSGSATGMYEVAFRHTTNNDEFTCLKCHFAHGTDVTVMRDAQDNTVASLELAGVPAADATAYMLDKNPSSALKRYTNMAVCWKCHTESKATQLKNNGYYWDSYFSNDPNKVPDGFGE